MLCAREERLEDRIVRIVIDAGAQKAEHLHKTLNHQGNGEDWSLAATYKALKKLVDNGVLVHSKGHYYIAQSWIFSVSNLIDRHFERPPGGFGAEYLLPPAGGTFSWRYTDLRRLNSFASNIILVATQRERPAMIYSWSPHLWFNLVQQEHERHYHNALRGMGVRVVKVIGGDSRLDRITAADLPRGVVSSRLLSSKQILPRNHYTIVVGDFVITMKLQRKTADDIDTLFERAKDLDSLDVRLLLKLFRYSDSPSTLTVEHNRTKASQLRDKIGA